MTPQIFEMHRGIAVVRDDVHPGGTKARFIGMVFEGVQEAVYASPPEGGAHPEPLGSRLNQVQQRMIAATATAEAKLMASLS